MVGVKHFRCLDSRQLLGFCPKVRPPLSRGPGRARLGGHARGKKTGNGLWCLGMTAVTFAVIQLDAATLLIPGQIISMAATPVIWGIGAAVIWKGIKGRNAQEVLYHPSSFGGRDALLLFFVLACGAAMAAGSYLYTGLKPLFIRELFTSYPLYNLRNLLYYPLEVWLMLELLICAQGAGEALAKRPFPWGALALFLLWGLPHILWHGVPDGIVSALRAFLYSVPFYASGKKARTSYLGMVILWFL